MQGTLITAVQGNITSVGQLISLNVTGTTTTNQLQAGLVGNSGALLQGTLITAAQPNITSTGTLSSLNVTNTVTANIYTGAAVYAGAIGNSGASLSGATLTLTGQANMANTAVSSVYITGGVYWQSNGNPIGSYSPLAIAAGGNTMMQFNNAGTTYGSTYLQYNITSGNLVSNSTTISTSTTTGALVVPSVGVSGNVNANAFYSNYFLYANGSTIVTPPSGANTFIQFNSSGSFGGANYLQYNITSGNLVSNSATISTSQTTGALVLSGGVGVGGAINAANLSVTPVAPNPTNGINTLGLYTSGSYGGGIGLLDGTWGWGIYDTFGQLNFGNSTGATGSVTQRIQFGNSGTITAGGNITAQSGNLYAAYVIANTGILGTLQTAAQTNITSLGALTSLTMAGAINGQTINGTSILGTTIGNTASAVNGNLVTASAIYAGTIGNTGASLVGTISTAAQTNITSLGALTSLTMAGAINGQTINGTSILGTTIGNTASAINGNIHTGSAIYAGTIGNTGAVYTGATATFNGGLSQVATNFNTNPASQDAGRIFAIYNTNYLPGASYSSSDSRIIDIGVTTGNIAYFRHAGSNGLQFYVGGNGTSFNNAILPTSNASINIGGTGTNYWNSVYAVSFVGTISTAAQTNITSLGALTSLTMAGAINGQTINGTSILGTTIGNTNTVHYGTTFGATTAFLPTANNAVSLANATNYMSSIYGVNYYVANVILPVANLNPSIGTAQATFNNIYAVNFLGTSTTAKYADLAEMYLADAQYQPGTVLIFGGDDEVTTTDISHDPRIAGIVSTNPAYLMNDNFEDGYYVPVGLTGRLPCFVQGPVKKGDILVASSIKGVAQKLSDSEYRVGCVIGKCLENHDLDTIKKIEVVVGRF